MLLILSQTLVLKARVNIAAPSLRTIERRTVSSEYSTEPEIQVNLYLVN